MNSIRISSKPNDFLIIFLSLQVVVYILVFLNVPVVRQVVGFAYLTLVPGFVFIKLLKLDELSRLETLLFSVGFSVAFLMIGGLFINEFGFLFGISQPLTFMPLFIILSSIVLIGVIFVYVRSEGKKLLETETNGVSPVTVLLIALPILAIVGAIWVNAYSNNQILLLLLIVISLIFVIGTISQKLPARFFAVAVFVIALSLLFHSSLISRYLVSFGSDNPIELAVLKTTLSNGYWNPIASSLGRYNSMLSITILPTIYSVLLNLNPTNVFKILYPLIFALVPVGLYQLWQKNFGKKTAFIAAFLLMADLTFYTEMLGLNREMIAELFFVLLLLTLSMKMKMFNKIVCFIVFSFALITAHYSLALIFFLFISIAWAASLIYRKTMSRNITAAMLVLCLGIMFSWYLFTSGGSTFNSIMQFGSYVNGQLGQFFNPASRGTGVLSGLGLESSPTIWNTVSRVFAYATEGLIVIGFIGLIIKRKKVPLNGQDLMFIVLAVAALVALVAVPGLANTLDITRFYHILLFFLAPLCVLGAETFVKLISKRRTVLVASILLVIVLVPYFLFQTGLVYEVVGARSFYSLGLGLNKMSLTYQRYDMGYFDASEVAGAIWISKNAGAENSTIYADVSSGTILVPYCLGFNDVVLLNVTALAPDSYIYLNKANIIDKVVVDGSQYIFNTTSISPVLESADKIYSNGACDIYKTG